MIIEKHKTLFIHIPKNAGTSIKMYFDKDLPKPFLHNTIHDVKALIKNHDVYKKFAVVRNPYDRMVSWFFYLKESCKNDGFNLKEVFDIDFNDWVEDPNKSFYVDRYVPKYLLQPQHYWVDETVSILKYENLDKELNNFFNEKIDLQITNKSKHGNYLKYYNKNSFKIVYDRYKEDFNKFNYRKL